MEDSLNFKEDVSFGLGKGMSDGVKYTGHVSLVLRDENGNLKDTREIHNTVTNAGRYGLMDNILATPTGTGYTAKPNWMEVGTGTPATTILGAYVSGSRTACSSITRASNVVTFVCTFAAGVGTGALTEAGVFDVVTQNTAYLWMSTNFATVNKASGDSLQITWTLTAS
jgi:hypothetical protein